MSTSQLKYTVSRQDIFHFPKSHPKICVVKPFPGLSNLPPPPTPPPYPTSPNIDGEGMIDDVICAKNTC